MRKRWTFPVTDVVNVRARALLPGTVTVGFEHPYFEAGWLPRLGPTAWVVWRTIGTRLAEQEEASWSVEDLARRHGIQAPALVRSFARLGDFKVLGHNGRELLVVSACIPLSPGLLRQSDDTVRRLHETTFPT